MFLRIVVSRISKRTLGAFAIASTPCLALFADVVATVSGFPLCALSIAAISRLTLCADVIAMVGGFSLCAEVVAPTGQLSEAGCFCRRHVLAHGIYGLLQIAPLLAGRPRGYAVACERQCLAWDRLA